MDEYIAIHRLSERLGLTSRTLRHWESEGLFESRRDPDSGWRCYDGKNAFFIRITALLREYGIALKDIRQVLESGSCSALRDVIRRSLGTLAAQRRVYERSERSLAALLQSLECDSETPLTEEVLGKLPTALPARRGGKQETEDDCMSGLYEGEFHVRFVILPPMRAAYHVAVGPSPEDEALKAVTGWLNEQNLAGTARIFGGNMPPMPDGSGKPYGYGVLASIPEGVAVPASLKEMRLPGGLYAMAECGDDIGGSWKRLMRYLSAHGEYEPDRSRLCLEEHIRNDAPEGSGREYFLNLLEPVKRK